MYLGVGKEIEVDGKNGKQSLESLEMCLKGVFYDINRSYNSGAGWNGRLSETTESARELIRNVLLLYPYIHNCTISHGKAAEILGMEKYDLIELYDSLGLAYLSMDIKEVEAEVEAWEKLQ